jgi:Protein of unknown function (DUF3617)
MDDRWEERMRTSIFLGAVLVSAALLFAASNYQPLKVKTGLWQVTTSSDLAGSPHTNSYKTCVTAKDFKTNPWAKGSDDNCDWSVVSSTASDMEVRGSSCAAGKDYGMDTKVDIKFHAVDSENVKASLQGTATGNGQTMNFQGTYAGKWIGSDCPAGTD